MQLFELQPTRENVLTTFSENLIDRNEDLFHFLILLDSLETSYSIALDGRWGSGKTFFVKQAQMALEAYNLHWGSVTEDERNSILTGLAPYVSGFPDNTLESKPQLAVYYDAWSNDNDVDPALSLVYEIIKAVNPDFKMEGSIDLLQLAASIAEAFTRRAVTTFFEKAKGNRPLACINAQKDLHAMIAEFLDASLHEKGNRLVVFIDELDRCKPSYAVQLLERIKHYFSNDRITFVFSINSLELQHTIKQHYGQEFDGCKYLDRFFDMNIALPPANMSRYYQKIGLSRHESMFEYVCEAVIKAFHFEMREIGRFYSSARVAVFRQTHNSENPVFPEEKALHFCNIFIVPILIGLRVTSIDNYTSFISGQNIQPLIDVLGNGEIAMTTIDWLWDAEAAPDREFNPSKLRNKLTQVYDALFAHSYSSGVDCIKVGTLKFTHNTKYKLMRAASLLSRYADYYS